MSTVSTTLTTWEEFVRLPDEEEGMRHELHDGEVVIVPPPKPIHVLIQILMEKWLNKAARGRGTATRELAYRPAANLQYWVADVAYFPNEDLKAMRTDEYYVYSPPLIIE